MFKIHLSLMGWHNLVVLSIVQVTAISNSSIAWFKITKLTRMVELYTL